jgi:elongation factor P hydroxylase
MKPKIITDSKLVKLFGADAMVLWPFILFAPGKLYHSTWLHEMAHWKQIKRYTVVGFYALYLWQYLVNRAKGMSHFRAYYNMPLEIEARKHELIRED